MHHPGVPHLLADLARRARVRRLALKLVLTVMCVVTPVLLWIVDRGFYRCPASEEAARNEATALVSLAEQYVLRRWFRCEDIGGALFVAPDRRFDPWGTPYAMQCEEGEIVVCSAAADRIHGTADDVCSDDRLP